MAALPTCTDTLLPSESGGVLKLAELWSFVQAKVNPLWWWVALCRRTRQIIAYTASDRRQRSAADPLASLPEGYRQHAPLRCPPGSRLFQFRRTRPEQGVPSYPSRTCQGQPFPNARKEPVPFHPPSFARLSRKLGKTTWPAL